MRDPVILESRAHTFYVKKEGIPKGCQQCLKGAKAVLFLNGICQNPKHCWWYCPISEKRKGKKDTYINEIQISSKEQILHELKAINAKGMSITGGDPLYEPNLKKTLEYIKFIKENKGKKFHIHLYTNGLNFSEEIAAKLARAGLDEIRFNPAKENWNVIKYALNKGMSVGAEVPVIPDAEYIENLKKFIFYMNKIGADFINLNEFEYTLPNSQNLKDRNFKLEAGTIASVKNSKECAIKLIHDIVPKVSIKIHFCTIIAKDYWQLRERYLRRAKTIKLPYEEITRDGLLLYALIEGEKKDIKAFYNLLLNELKVPQNFLSYEVTYIKLPIKFALEEFFMDLLIQHNLKGYIIEMIPFREEKYQQITEKTPIRLFKEEMGLNDY
ncbi:MAG TPA: radical SAM protein [Candidatus Nanopelagicaceae bacterium]|nr:radical SAM protein [Candidatus Nanopelagicaceae bacterium]